MKFFHEYILAGVLTLPWFYFSGAALANSQRSPHTKSINTIPESGWTVWRPTSEIPKADFSSGFSNMELGGYLDFEHSCNENSDVPKEKVSFWFRLTHSVSRIGTGEVEYGCWVKGHFFNTITNTAIKASLENVNCLRVNSPIGNGLLVRSEPRQNSARLGVVANGKTVNPGTFPANIIESNYRNWVAIDAPIKGWVSDGNRASQGNLRLCKR